MKDIQIGSRLVGSGHRPFIIAEMSGNHNQSLDRALKIVDEAARVGAHGLKIQTYTADTMTLDIDDAESLWKGTSLHKLYEKAHTPWEWHAPIFERCRELGLIAFSTPFDATAVDFLEELKVPAYKVASFENIDIPLLRNIAKTKKSVIMSTGMASISELDEAVKTLRDNGCSDLILLKCTSSYPASPENTNIRTIPHLRNMFDLQVGLSDHTMGIGVALASIAFGATVIEKHFTVSRAEGGVDSAFSLEPEEFHSLVIESERAWQALGEISYGLQECEKRSLQFRRSLYITEDVKAGETLNDNNLRAIRPGFGLAPRYLDKLLGEKVRKHLKRGTPVSWDILQ